VSARVFIIQSPHNPARFDFTEAARFGVIQPPVLDADDQVTMSADVTLRKLRDGLRDFTSKDYLVCVGDPVAIGLAFIVADAVTDGNFRVLKWDRVLGNGAYWVVSCQPRKEVA
jgi:hypothetical protein